MAFLAADNGRSLGEIAEKPVSCCSRLTRMQTKPAQIDKVTAADALRVAKQYINPNAIVVVEVGDLAKIEPELKKLDLGPVNVVQ